MVIEATILTKQTATNLIAQKIAEALADFEGGDAAARAAIENHVAEADPHPGKYQPPGDYVTGDGLSQILQAYQLAGSYAPANHRHDNLYLGPDDLSNAIAAHKQELDPHPAYATDAELTAANQAIQQNQQAIAAIQARRIRSQLPPDNPFVGQIWERFNSSNLLFNIFEWDGLYWKTVQDYPVSIFFNSVSGTIDTQNIPFLYGLDLWVESITFQGWMGAGTYNSDNRWGIQLLAEATLSPTVGASGVIFTPIPDLGLTPGNFVRKNFLINRLVSINSQELNISNPSMAQTTASSYRFRYSKTNFPPNINHPQLTARLRFVWKP